MRSMDRAASPPLRAATALAVLALVSATGGPFTGRGAGGAERGGDTAAAARPPAFPSRRAVAAARRYVARRAGSVSFALIDSRGRLYGYAPGRPYVSASVTKAMMLVAYLRRIGRRPPRPAERAELGPMITRSDNGRADVVYGWVGDPALRALAARAGMRSFSVSGYWASARITAADQARFFLRIDLLVPRRNRGYARRLLSSVVGWQRWGFSRAARRAGFRIFFKGGWRGTSSGRLVHEAALFERGSTRFAMAVLTDGDPTHEYGTATLRGVARRIFRGARRRAGAAARPAGLRRAGLADVTSLAPGIRVGLAYGGRSNLTGRRLPGYCRPWAYLLRPGAADLARVQRRLRRRGLGLLVLDAYRPARAQAALVTWARRSGRGDLVGRYIALRSRHSAGGAVDLTLVRSSDGRRLAMGTGYDHLGPAAHTLAAGGRALHHRLILKRAMERFGFSAYWREWWHFEHRVQGARQLDLTLGCTRENPR
jgi:D-alanyl-D-alanine dipeptidase